MEGINARTVPKGGCMDKRWLLLGLIVFTGCAAKDPEEDAKQELDRMATKSKNEKKEIAKEELKKDKF